jgi:hypothetical protein
MDKYPRPPIFAIDRTVSVQKDAKRVTIGQPNQRRRHAKRPFGADKSELIRTIEMKPRDP